MVHSFNDKINTIKWVGILTMTIDHIGIIFFRVFFGCELLDVLLFLVSFMGLLKEQNAQGTIHVIFFNCFY